MKYLVILMVSVLSINQAVMVEGKNYKGYIFEASYDILMSVKDQKSRYTPKPEEIEKVECLISDQLEGLNGDRLNQVDGCPIIHSKLKKYTRQYVGFVNNNNERIVWVNMVWTKNIRDFKMSEEIFTTYDGCSFYWNVLVNLDKGLVSDLDVNGIG